jgi:hypothetical protein
MCKHLQTRMLDTDTSAAIYASKTKVFCPQQRAEYICLMCDDIHLAIHKYIANLLYLYTHTPTQTHHQTTSRAYCVLQDSAWTKEYSWRNIPSPHRHSEKLPKIFLQAILGALLTSSSLMFLFINAIKTRMFREPRSHSFSFVALFASLELLWKSLKWIRRIMTARARARSFQH